MTQANTQRKPTTDKRSSRVTLVQAIMVGTVIALLINTVMVVKNGYAQTAQALQHHNERALITLAKRNLTLASWVVGTGIAATLLPHEVIGLAHDALSQIKADSTVQALGNTSYAKGFGRIIHTCKQGWHLLTLTFEGVVIKAVSLLASLLLLAVAVLLGLLDGFSKRYVRTCEGGRESTYVYHKAVSSSVSLPGFCMVLYVLLPNPLSPEIAVLLLAVVLFFVGTVKCQPI